MVNDPIVQILIEAAQRGRELRRQREAAQRAAQQNDQPAMSDDTRRQDAQRAGAEVNNGTA